ncbi:MAG: hypothetical protein AB1306_01330 [Nitrospirota bacterium]
MILGSTNEYRDWAFEERCDVTVVDNSRSFHKAISEDRRYKNAAETVIYESWGDMKFYSEYDLALGDLIVGNVAPSQIERLLLTIHRSLRAGGCFITKSFFHGRNGITSDNIYKILHEIEISYPCHDPFPIMAYPLTIAAMDRKTHMLDFANMFEIINQAYQAGFVSARVLKRYQEFGWHVGAKITFYVMPVDMWRTYVDGVFTKVSTHTGPYEWSQDFPVYLMKK